MEIGRKKKTLLALTRWVGKLFDVFDISQMDLFWRAGPRSLPPNSEILFFNVFTLYDLDGMKFEPV